MDTFVGEEECMFTTNKLFLVRKTIRHEELSAISIEDDVPINLVEIHFRIGNQIVCCWNKTDLERLKGQNMLNMFLVEDNISLPLARASCHVIRLEYYFDSSDHNEKSEEEVWKPADYTFGDDILVNLKSLRMDESGYLEELALEEVQTPICVIPRTNVVYTKNNTDIPMEEIPIWTRVKVPLQTEHEIHERDGDFFIKNILRIKNGLAGIKYSF